MRNRQSLNDRLASLRQTMTLPNREREAVTYSSYEAPTSRLKRPDMVPKGFDMNRRIGKSRIAIAIIQWPNARIFPK
jgi:hypothetical protein